MVVALGVQTDHWVAVRTSFPCILNCCVDTRKAFQKEYDEDVSGSGFDEATRGRMREKASWNTVWAVAQCVFWEFALVIVLCNHGRHRSLSVAWEVSAEWGCELVSIRDPESPWQLRSVKDVMQDLGERLDFHRRTYGDRPCPVFRIRVSWVRWDGEDWKQREIPEHRSWNYLTLKPGDVVVEVRCDEKVSGSGMNRWGYGLLVGSPGSASCGWYPPTALCAAPSWCYWGRSLMPSALPKARWERRSGD